VAGQLAQGLVGSMSEGGVGAGRQRYVRVASLRQLEAPSRVLLR